MPNIEPLRRKPLLEEEQQNYRRNASLTKTHNVYFIEGTEKDAKAPLRRFMGYMEVFPRKGELVNFGGVKFEVTLIEHVHKYGSGRPTIYIYLKKKS